MILMDKISVIIPVYNVSKYLEKCLKSVLEQSYKNLEIILVNDGSSDDSLKICEQYEKKYSKIKLIDLEKNYGISYARNKGLLYAKGKYIIFIDSDDWLEINMIESLYNNLVKNNADMSICDYYINFEKKEKIHNLYCKEEIIAEKEKMYKYLLDNAFYGGYLWNKLIKKDIIDNSNIKFDERVKVCEDLFFLSKVLENVEKIVYSPKEKLYHYRQRKNSAVNFSYSLKDMTKLIVLNYFIENNYIYDGLFYDYFILNCQSKYILKKEGINDMLFSIKEECKKYFKDVFLQVKGPKKIRVILWYFFPIFCGMIFDRNKKNRIKK